MISERCESIAKEKNIETDLLCSVQNVCIPTALVFIKRHSCYIFIFIFLEKISSEICFFILLRDELSYIRDISADEHHQPILSKKNFHGFKLTFSKMRKVRILYHFPTFEK